ncbi:hypothetical protein PAHAL_2G427700 [Panicum hallii]|uniref:Uncharacterized protein n=1 Tax=Panicum hallii TaxID=206008 RepID=A0A2T8KSH2_9POAL|nr:hypothetical protein PAHAL_2G427700 [Panicum hallii]
MNLLSAAKYPTRLLLVTNRSPSTATGIPAYGYSGDAYSESLAPRCSAASGSGQRAPVCPRGAGAWRSQWWCTAVPPCTRGLNTGARRGPRRASRLAPGNRGRRARAATRAAGRNTRRHSENSPLPAPPPSAETSHSPGHHHLPARPPSPPPLLFSPASYLAPSPSYCPVLPVPAQPAGLGYLAARSPSTASARGSGASARAGRRDRFCLI